MQPSQCVVIGAGLAGAAVAASLARRGWQVQVLDAAAACAAGASGLPAGLVVPHVSKDDNLQSQLSCIGMNATWDAARRLLVEGQDYAITGVQQRFAASDTDAAAPPLWHGSAGWLKPWRLVEALLMTPGVQFRGTCPVHALQRQGDAWQVLDQQQQLLAQAALLVLCAGFGSHALLGQALPLQALRGQVSWGLHAGAAHAAGAFPATPVNGEGNFIAHVPTPEGAAWYLGSTFERDNTDPRPSDADHQANYARLQRLLPETAQALQARFDRLELNAFAAVRCVAHDRMPVVGPLNPVAQPGLWISGAMGARGLTLAVLCAELLAAQLHGEALPLEPRLAQILSSQRRGLARAARLRPRVR